MFKGRAGRSNFKFISMTISIILAVILAIFSVILFQNNEKTISAYEQTNAEALNSLCEQALNRVANIGVFFGTMGIQTTETESEEYYQNKQIEEKIAVSTANASYIKYISIKRDAFLYVSASNGIFLDEKSVSDKIYSLGNMTNTKVFYTTEGSYNNNIYFLFERSKESGLYNDVSVGVNNYSFGKELLTDNIKERKNYIINSKGEIISSDEHSLIYKNIFEEFDFSLDTNKTNTVKLKVKGENSYCTINKMGELDLYTVVITDVSYYRYYYQVTTVMVLLILLLSFVGIFVLSNIIDRKTYGPILKIVDNIKSMSPEVINQQNMDEVAFINNQFEHLSELNSKLEVIIEQKHNEIRKNNAQILQSQICPHFIYNTLDAINWKSFDLYGQQNPISGCISSISEILPYVMDVEELTISIDEEVKIIYDYINILKFRYDEEIDFTVDIADEIKNIRILKFCIQPALENAVQHGLKLHKGEWKIKLSIFPEGEDDIIVEVRDNGVGIPKEKLPKIRKKINDFDDVSVLHIGLRNINRRIKLLYGEDYGINIRNARNGGAVCRMKMKRDGRKN
ncbi:MAG: histidine kinase [Clostridia bacterium]|nr:histidine kinase [Clostridia bacterium]